ncbi:MAG: universal stress protein [Candidatus Latescibacterota bacterium]
MSDPLFKIILLMVETTQEAMKAAKLAIALAGAHHARLIGLHVVDRTVIERIQRFGDKKRSEIEIEVEENGWNYLYHVEERALEQQVGMSLVQEEGLPEHVIVKKAEAFHADLIVLGMPKARSGVRHFTTANVERIIEHAPCPVLTVT